MIFLVKLRKKNIKMTEDIESDEMEIWNNFTIDQLNKVQN